MIKLKINLEILNTHINNLLVYLHDNDIYRAIGRYNTSYTAIASLHRNLPYYLRHNHRGYSWKEQHLKNLVAQEAFILKCMPYHPGY